MEACSTLKARKEKNESRLAAGINKPHTVNLIEKQPQVRAHGWVIDKVSKRQGDNKQ
jgi:hypothetical protein